MSDYEKYRFDYLKLLLHIDQDLFDHYYHEVQNAALEVLGGSATDWERCHAIHPLGAFEGGQRRYAIDVWGSAAEAFRHLPQHVLRFVNRLDVRRECPELDGAKIIDLGQRLQTHVTRWNVNVYSTRAATKRNGRDRGGKGLAIGSHKSDLRVTQYIRKGERAALEFQCSGAALERVLSVEMERHTISPETGSLADGVRDSIVNLGTARYAAAWAQVVAAELSASNARVAGYHAAVRQAPLFEDDSYRGITGAQSNADSDAMAPPKRQP